MSVVYSHIPLVDFVITVGNAGDHDGQADHHHGGDDLTLDMTPGRAAHRLENGHNET